MTCEIKNLTSEMQDKNLRCEIEIERCEIENWRYEIKKVRDAELNMRLVVNTRYPFVTSTGPGS